MAIRPKGGTGPTLLLPPPYHLHAKRRDHICLAIKQKDFFKIGRCSLCCLLRGRFAVKLCRETWREDVEVKGKHMSSTCATHIQKISHGAGVMTHALHNGEGAVNLV